MLQDSRAFSGFSVNNLEAAKKFYGEALGLQVTEQKDMGLELTLGTGAKVFIYTKPNHEPASFTILNFPVADIDEVVDNLAAKGIAFEHYDNEYIHTDEKGIARSDSPDHGPTIAWFKDPAGNVLSVLQS